MKISLFYIAKSVVGGWVTFTTHLIRSLNQLGYTDIQLYKIGKRDERLQRKYCEDVTYQNVTLETAIKIAEETASLIVALDKRFYEVGLPILKACKSIVIHDPTEITKDFAAIMRDNNKKAILIRNAVQKFLIEKDIDSEVILHPYVAYEIPKDQEKEIFAVSTSRIDWDKYIHFTVKANTLLPEERQVQVYGYENRLYSHYKIENFCPEWRDKWYKGNFSRHEFGQGSNLARKSQFTIDLTEIKGDGGGTQYTFLEAFNAFSTLVINRKWLSSVPPDRLVEGTNCLAVESGEELRDLLIKDDIDHDLIRNNALKLLQDHRPVNIVPKYLEALGIK